MARPTPPLHLLQRQLQNRRQQIPQRLPWKHQPNQPLHLKQRSYRHQRLRRRQAPNQLQSQQNQQSNEPLDRDLGR